MLSRYNFIIVVLLTFVCFVFISEQTAYFCSLVSSKVVCQKNSLFHIVKAKKLLPELYYFSVFKWEDVQMFLLKRLWMSKHRLALRQTGSVRSVCSSERYFLGFFTAIALLIMGLKFNWYDWQISYGIPILSELVST